MIVVVAALVVLNGTVTTGPTSPVCRTGVPCVKPAAGVVLTFTSGARSMHATTRKDGSYVVRLAPGTYAVTTSSVNPAAAMRITPATVTVRAGPRKQNFAIDTGLR